MGVQKEQIHLLSYSYATGSKARAGSPPQHLGEGGSFVGALEGSVVGGPGLLEAQWLGFPLASSPAKLPDFPLTFSCLPPAPSKQCLPQIPNSSQTLRAHAVPSASVSWNPAEAPSSPGWPGQGAGQMGQDTHCQPGSRFWTGRRGCKCGSWSCAGRPVFSCPSPATPPPHRLHPFTDRHPVGRGARSGQRRPLSPGLKQAALCPLLQPWMPPPRRGPKWQGPGGREVGKVLGRRNTERPSGLFLPCSTLPSQ